MKRANEVNLNTREYWNKVYQDPEAYLSEHTHPGGSHSARFTKTLEYIENGDVVLDLGCGVGEFCELVKDTYPACAVVGLDISDTTMRENAKKRPDIDWGACTIGKDKVGEKESFDVVFSGETLEHLDIPSDLFKESFRVLKKGGKLIITTPKEDAITSPEHTWFFTQQDVESLFLNNGFNNVRFQYLPNQEHMMVIYAVGVK